MSHQYVVLLRCAGLTLYARDELVFPEAGSLFGDADTARVYDTLAAAEEWISVHDLTGVARAVRYIRVDTPSVGMHTDDGDSDH